MFIPALKRTIAATVGIMLLAGAALASGYKNITAKEANGLIAKQNNVFILDVRTPEEFRQVHLKDAVLIPVGELERRIREVPKNRPVVVYCAVGSRSNAAAVFLGKQGYREVYNISDGIVGWYRNGLPVAR